LGDPNGHKVLVDGVSNQELMEVDCKVENSKLAISFLELLFTKAELSSGCATKPQRADITKLDTHRLNAIRGEHTCRKKWFEFRISPCYPFLAYTAHVHYRFPGVGEMFSVSDANRRKKIPQEHLNVHCRQH